MIAQMRPDIATVTEQTVLNLKELEARIGVLKNDLAWLCQGLGHNEAARLAAAPAAPPSLSNPSANPFTAMAAANPLAAGIAVNPYGGSGFAVSPFAAWPTQQGALQAFGAGFAPGYAAFASPAFGTPVSAFNNAYGNAYGTYAATPFGATYGTTPFAAVPSSLSYIPIAASR
jgi:uncharacterized small protein (DUF1192 family)